MTNSPLSPQRTPCAWFLLLGMVYFALYGALLLYSDFLPYVTDNNETFSSIVHASNIYHFGVGKTYGLTDEAYGLSAAAHPYVYTHQGNFPRFFALMLYAFGARSAESQIFLTTFTIGLVGVGFAFRYFSVATNNLFALIFCLLLISDYVMFAQWQVNTWQLWHVFFFFSSLLWVHRLGESRTGRWLAVGVLNFACLFYYEILFTVFVVTFCGVYAAYRYRGDFGALARACAILAGGPALGAAVLVAQSVAYLGWNNFMLDLQLTYTGRNQATSGADLLRQLETFYEENHIVFWHNLVDAGYLRSPLQMARYFIDSSLLVYSPFLIVGAVASCLAWLLRVHFMRQAASKRLEIGEGVDGRPKASERSLLLAAAFTTFAAATLIDLSFMGSPENDTSANLLALKIVVLPLIFVATKKDFGSLLGSNAAITFGQIMGTLVFLLLSAAFVRVQQSLYDLSYAPLWGYVGTHFTSPQLLQFCIIAIVWLLARRILGEPAHSTASGSGWRLGMLGPYLVCGLVAYAATAFILPGYLKTVYLDRFAPLTVFFHLVPFALLIYVLSASAWPYVVYGGRSNVFHKVYASGSRKAAQNLSRTSPTGVIAVAALAVVVAYWIGLQAAYTKLLPPDHFSFLTRLKAPPFKGASFAVNTYAAPIAVATGNWAYFDPILGQDLTLPTEYGFEVKRDLRLLWLADKEINRNYLEPDYFLCINPQGLKSAIDSLRRFIRAPGCSGLPLARTSTHRPPPSLNHTVVLADQSNRDGWAVVKLDWDYPPYLRQLSAVPMDDATRVAVRTRQSPATARITFDIDYRYAQQKGKPEAGTMYALYALKDPAHGCARADEIEPVAQSPQRDNLSLPDTFSGIAKIGVTPRTATKTGREYYSKIFSVGTRNVECTSGLGH